MVSQENTMNVGNDAAGYIPVEADLNLNIRMANLR